MTKKSDKTAKRKKLKLPKEFGGVKIPKDVRKEGNRLIAAATALITTQAAAAMLQAATRVRFEPGPGPERRNRDERNGCGVER